MSKTDAILLDSILEWYNENPHGISRFMSIVKRKHGLSLRLIDWLVTNYSKCYSLTIDTSDPPRDLNRDYQKNLNAYNKKNMDPFARRNKIKVSVKSVNGNVELRSTTIGQLNFFKWFISNGIEEILRRERCNIESHMKQLERNKGNKDFVKSKSKISAPHAYVGSFNMTFSF